MAGTAAKLSIGVIVSGFGGEGEGRRTRTGGRRETRRDRVIERRGRLGELRNARAPLGLGEGKERVWKRGVSS